MIATLLRISWTNLKRDRVAQMLTFLLPIVFFSIFATVFGNQGNASTARIRVAVVDEDGSELSRADRRRAAEARRALRARTTPDAEGRGAALDRAAAEALVRDGDVPVAIVLPQGLGATRRGVRTVGRAAPHIQLLADVSDRIAPQMVYGLLQKVAMTAAPDLMMQGGIAPVRAIRGRADAAAARGGRRLAAAAEAPAAPARHARRAAPATGAFGDRHRHRRRHAQGQSREPRSRSTPRASASCSCCSRRRGASGALLDEVDTGTLDRVLSTRVGMTRPARRQVDVPGADGRRLQLTVMFLWGRLAFGLDLFHHLPGFVVMTVFTAAAAAGFGLVLATLARTRAQLSGHVDDHHPDDVGARRQHVSALPDERDDAEGRPADVQRVGARRLPEGVLARAPLWQLWPQVLVLAALTAVFLGIARTLARRWEAA